MEAEEDTPAAPAPALVVSAVGVDLLLGAKRRGGLEGGGGLVCTAAARAEAEAVAMALFVPVVLFFRDVSTTGWGKRVLPLLSPLMSPLMSLPLLLLLLLLLLLPLLLPLLRLSSARTDEELTGTAASAEPDSEVVGVGVGVGCFEGLKVVLGLNFLAAYTYQQNSASVAQPSHHITTHHS